MKGINSEILNLMNNHNNIVALPDSSLSSSIDHDGDLVDRSLV